MCRPLLPIVLTLLLPGLSGGQELARWSFEQTDAGTAGAGARLEASRRVDGSTGSYSDTVPGLFIYDPVTRTSRRNAASGIFAGGERQSGALATKLSWAEASAGLTLEAFVLPAADAGGNAWLVGKSRTSDQGAELALEFHHLQNARQTWHGASVLPPGGRTDRWAIGHYSSSTRLHPQVRDWRHVAVVYDAEAKAVTSWVDYHLSRKVALEKPPVWDDGPLLIGGRADRWGAAAMIDEVRVSRGALSPAMFLRARGEAIEGVSFVSDQTVVPRDSGCLDAKEHFGAAGDGKTDDTAALNAAFKHLASKVPLAYNTLILPPGEYLVSGMLHCSRFIDVKGSGPGKTVIRLKDGTFTDPAKPLPVLRMSSTAGDPGSHRGVNGSSISLYLDGLTIDTGKGNPGAKALEFHSNNIGRLENVVLRSGDGTGVLGLDLTHHDVGPALVKRVTVEGFDLGAAIRYQEYSMTLEHVTLRGQRVAGLRNQGNILAIRKLTSENQVPAIVCEGPNSMAVLLDSELRGGSADQPAIKSDGALYALRVKTSGYGQAVAKRILVDQNERAWKDESVAGPNLDEYIGDRPVVGHGQPSGALKLPIEETPEPAIPPVSEWVNIAHFAKAEHGGDAGPALQAAIESGAKVVYLPRDFSLECKTPVRLHAPLERLVGLGGELRWSAEVWKGAGRREQTDPAAAAPPLLIFDEPDAARVIVLDRLGCQHLRHASPATLVLRSSSPDRYSTGQAGGKLFAEDIGGADWHFDHPQQVWVRQWNPESHAAGPCIHSRGATIWSLGFKTEYESQKLLAEAGASTEILGSFIYPLGKIPPERPIFENRDSRIALIYGTSVYQANHKIHIRDARGSDVKEIANDQLNWAGSRARMDLYSSDAR
ncbi:MAG: glycosyl hydrolase family 28-related protein [Pirellulaceae bacterium]|nr:glycosyl hydrolase family 28-related protein [Pirellulaceae bacterium]